MNVQLADLRPQLVAHRMLGEVLEPAAHDVSAGVARHRVHPQQDDVDPQDDVAQAEPETRRRVHGLDGVHGVDQREDRGDVEEVPVQVLQDQWEACLAGVGGVWLGHPARRRGLPHRAVVGAAVVVAGQPEQQQERQREQGIGQVRQQAGAGKNLRPEIAGLTAVDAHARRIERRQVVVLLDEEVVPLECPHGRVDHERGKAQVGEDRGLQPVVGSQCLLRDLGPAGRKDAGATPVRGGCAHLQ